jgi:peptidylprolyl isomerase
MRSRRLVPSLLLLAACGHAAPTPTGTVPPSNVANATEMNTDARPAPRLAPPPPPVDVAAPPPSATRTSSGLAYKVLATGAGNARPTATSSVVVHYTGWTTDGRMFDSSVPKGTPAVFPLAALIAGWTEGLQLMVVGDRTRFWIPEALAYKGSPGKPAGMLVFDVELLDIK